MIETSNRKGWTPRNGFTLIELLIVIAIILILIAIALPNFLEAQIRAKVTKAKGEIRGLAFAMEAYNLDWKNYPAETEGDWLTRSRLEAGHTWLTTPIAYIAQVPEDPFAGQSANGYRTYESGGIETFGGFVTGDCGPCMKTWAIYSSGPNESSEPALRSDAPHFTPAARDSNLVVTYSSTNGTRSGGILHWYGGDPFWIGVSLPSANRQGYNNAGGSLDTGLIVDQQFYLHRLPPHLQ